MSEEKKNPIKKLLANMPDNTNVNFFNNNKYIGIEIQVSRPGWGFEAITLSYNLRDCTWHLDDECTSKERVIQVIRDAAPPYC